jgi:hypothetical protein
MRFDFEPLIVTCNTCGKSAETLNGLDPDSAVECGCCPERHNHAGLGCRTVTITATARLSIFDVNDLMEAMGNPPLLISEEAVV